MLDTVAGEVEYDELRLRIDGAEGGRFHVLATSRGGEAAGEFRLPDEELARFLSHSRHRRTADPGQVPTAPARRFGQALFRAVFTDGIRDLYRTARARADEADRGLRLTLCLSGATELMDIPWEYLYDDRGFLAASVFTPVVRYLDRPRAPRPLKVELPINVLAIVSSPAGLDPLDVERERADLEHALADLLKTGMVSLEWLRRPTLAELLKTLDSGPFHVLHYIGHGYYDEASQQGALVLEEESGRRRDVAGDELGQILHDHRSLRLAVLNACEGARTGHRDPFTGVAAALVGHDIPAVVAMQADVTDAAAITFAGGFYRAIAAGLPVDAAIAKARLAIFAAQTDGIEWGSAVLFMRVADGRIFDLPDAMPPDPAAALRVRSAEPQDVLTSLTRHDRPTPSRRRPRMAITGVAGIVAVAAGVVITLGAGRAPARAAGDAVTKLCTLVINQTKASAGQNRRFAARMRNAPTWTAAKSVLELQVIGLTAQIVAVEPLAGALKDAARTPAIRRYAGQADAAVLGVQKILLAFSAALRSDKTSTELVATATTYADDSLPRLTADEEKFGTSMNELNKCSQRPPPPVVVMLQWGTDGKAAGSAAYSTDPNSPVFVNPAPLVLKYDMHLPTTATGKPSLLPSYVPVPIGRPGGHAAGNNTTSTAGGASSSSSVSGSGTTSSAPTSVSTSSSSSSATASQAQSAGSGRTVIELNGGGKPVQPGGNATTP